MAVRSVKCEDVCLRSLKTVTQSFSSRKIQHLGGIQSRSAAGAIVPLRAAPPVPARRDRFPLLPLRTHLLPPVPPCRARDPILNPFPLPPPRIVPLPLRAPDLPLLPLVSFRPLREF